MALQGVPPRWASGVLLLSRAERQAESIALETIRAVLSGHNTGLQLVTPYER